MKISNAHLQNVSIHYVGNKLEEQTLQLSQAPINLQDEQVHQLLQHFFLHPFKDKSYQQFYHNSDIHLNELYTYSKNIFTHPDTFHLQSIHIAKFLYEKCTHPNIKPGELYVTYFDDLELDGETCDAIGIFKTESKETFLKITPTPTNFDVQSEQGIDIKKIDKGCLIFNVKEEDGYRVVSIDNSNKSDAKYWIDDFLHIKSVEDNYMYTENIMQMCKQFVQEEIPENFDINKSEQIDLMNRSANFFKQKETFTIDVFEQEVFEQPELIDKFKSYKEHYAAQFDAPIVDEFDIHPTAAKKQSKIFKSILKLDKNFHVYIHGNKDRIEKGFDETTGLHFYKLLFNEEN